MEVGGQLEGEGTDSRWIGWMQRARGGVAPRTAHGSVAPATEAGGGNWYRLGECVGCKKKCPAQARKTLFKTIAIGEGG